MEWIFILLLFCLSKRHLSGFTTYEQLSWKQVFFINENDATELYVDGFPAGIGASGVLYFPPDRKLIQVRYMNGDQILLESEVDLSDNKTFFVARWQRNRLLRVK